MVARWRGNAGLKDYEHAISILVSLATRPSYHALRRRKIQLRLIEAIELPVLGAVWAMEHIHESPKNNAEYDQFNTNDDHGISNKYNHKHQYNLHPAPQRCNTPEQSELKELKILLTLKQNQRNTLLHLSSKHLFSASLEHNMTYLLLLLYQNRNIVFHSNSISRYSWARAMPFSTALSRLKLSRELRRLPLKAVQWLIVNQLGTWSRQRGYHKLLI